jgi:hypothetical protein
MSNQDPQTNGAKNQAAPARQPSDKASEQAAAKPAKKLDAIDEAAWETFPASDAPASWAGRDIPPDEKAQPDKDKS